VPTPTDRDRDVVVIGAGFAGVTVARELTQAGYSCALLEARDRIGGRTLYRRFADTSHQVEFGGTWVAPRIQPNIARELARYGLALRQSPEPANFLLRIGGEARRGFAIRKGERAELERAFYRLLTDARRIDPARPLDQQRLQDLDVSLADFISGLSLSRAAADFIRGWGVLYGGCEASEHSVLHLLLDVVEYGYTITAFIDALDDQLADGTTALIEAMCGEARADLRLSCPVARVAQDAERIEVFADTGEVFRGRIAVVCVPVNVWQDIVFLPELNPGKRRVAAAGHAGSATKLWVLAAEAPENLVAIGTGGPLAWLSTERRIDEGELLVGFGAHAEADLRDRADVQRAAEHLIPGVRVLAYDAHDWNADPYARGAWAWYRPGQLTRDHGALSEAEGRLIFAGSDIAPRWMSWIEGAIESGLAAATEADRRLRR
jgi:monoamine oxidase